MGKGSREQALEPARVCARPIEGGEAGALIAERQERDDGVEREKTLRYEA